MYVVKDPLRAYIGKHIDNKKRAQQLLLVCNEHKERIACENTCVSRRFGCHGEKKAKKGLILIHAGC